MITTCRGWRCPDRPGRESRNRGNDQRLPVCESHTGRSGWVGPEIRALLCHIGRMDHLSAELDVSREHPHYSGYSEVDKYTLSLLCYGIQILKHITQFQYLSYTGEGQSIKLIFRGLIIAKIQIHNIQFIHWRGVQGQKSWKHNFEIIGDPKGPTSGSTFWLGFEVPDPYGDLLGHAILIGPNRTQKIKNGN